MAPPLGVSKAFLLFDLFYWCPSAPQITFARPYCPAKGQKCSLVCTFYPNVTIRYVRVFVIANPSVVCLSSVTFVRPTQEIETFGNSTLAILWPPCKFSRRSSQENPSVGDVKRKRGSKIERCHVRVSHLLVSFLYLILYLRHRQVPEVLFSVCPDGVHLCVCAFMHPSVT